MLQSSFQTAIQAQIRESIETKRRILEDPLLVDRIAQATSMVVEAYKSGRKTLLAGNGGSAADAQHIAGEFVSRFYFDRPGLPSVALTTDSSIVTAIGNDYGYERVFSRQVEALGLPGDVLIGISTSGNSPNILAALEAGRAKGMRTIGLTGSTGGLMADICDVCINVPSSVTPRIQESHILVGHIICCLVEESLFGASRNPGQQAP